MAKKALCIGINNYPGTDMDLAGCVNDAKDWTAVLTARGFAVSQLLDDKATKDAMVKAISGLIASGSTGDSLVITFSGHGTYAPDENSDEIDGLDEALCPYDIAKDRPLLDDEIHAMFAQRKPGVRLLLISDSCHSGTVTRAIKADKNALAPRTRFLPLGAWLPKSKMPRSPGGKPAASVVVKASPSPWAGAMSAAQDDVLLSGCQEGPDNFSYDATIDGKPCGAFSYYAQKTLAKLKPSATYAQWHKAIREALPSASFPQTPQLVASKAGQKLKVLS